VQGNITSRSAGSASLGFVFDIGNRMTRAENVPGVGTVQYTYDGNGRRAWAAYPGGTHRGFAYGLDGKLLIVGDTVNGRIADWYIHLGDRQIGQFNLRAGAEFVHTDYLGSVVARGTVGGVLEATRTRYEPFGRVSSGFEPVGGGYTGHVHDSDTALIYMQQRYYEPLAGRFLSVDPVVTDAATGSSFNRYAYVGNNPYGFTDPSGRSRVGAESNLSQRYVYGDGPAADSKDDDGRQEENAREPIQQRQKEIVKRANDAAEWLSELLTEGAQFAVGGFGFRAVKWTLGGGKSAVTWANQMAKRGWNEKQIGEALGTKGIASRNAVNPGNPATRHVHPETGHSLVIDNKTNQIIHFGGKNFNYSHWDLRP